MYCVQVWELEGIGLSKNMELRVFGILRKGLEYTEECENLKDVDSSEAKDMKGCVINVCS